MFGIWKRRKTEVLDHHYAPIHHFETSIEEFYQGIAQELEARQLTGLEISRVHYAEGGLLSAKREYLRLRRERLVFDVCAAPFGTEWFFSWRVAIIPMQLHLWEVLVLLVTLALTGLVYVSLFGWILGSVLFAASLLSLLLLMRNTVTLGLQDVDTALLQIPVAGAIYETFLRKETYYREDTRLAYKNFVVAVIRAKIEEVTAAKGVQLVEYRDATPPSHPAVLSMIGHLLRLSSGRSTLPPVR